MNTYLSLCGEVCRSHTQLCPFQFLCPFKIFLFRGDSKSADKEQKQQSASQPSPLIMNRSFSRLALLSLRSVTSRGLSHGTKAPIQIALRSSQFKFTFNTSAIRSFGDAAHGSGEGEVS